MGAFKGVRAYRRLRRREEAQQVKMQSMEGEFVDQDDSQQDANTQEHERRDPAEVKTDNKGSS
jgi:hypothetical protein